jgi:hypothetical protein
LCSLLLLDGQSERLETVECFIVIWKTTYSWDRRIQLFSYELWWIKERWQVSKSLNIFFSLYIAEWRLETLYTMSFSFGDVYIVGTGGFNNELWWIQEGRRV